MPSLNQTPGRDLGIVKTAADLAAGMLVAVVDLDFVAGGTQALDSASDKLAKALELVGLALELVNHSETRAFAIAPAVFLPAPQADPSTLDLALSMVQPARGVQ